MNVVALITDDYESTLELAYTSQECRSYFITKIAITKD
jgi:hypothetical protein